MDRRAWQAAVHVVTTSGTRLKWLSTHSTREDINFIIQKVIHHWLGQLSTYKSSLTSSSLFPNSESKSLWGYHSFIASSPEKSLWPSPGLMLLGEPRCFSVTNKSVSLTILHLLLSVFPSFPPFYCYFSRSAVVSPSHPQTISSSELASFPLEHSFSPPYWYLIFPLQLEGFFLLPPPSFSGHGKTYFWVPKFQPPTASKVTRSLLLQKETKRHI